MNEDQIKAIAGKLVEGNILPEIALPLVKDVVKQLLEDYCIVERKKVTEEYKRISSELSLSNPLTAFANGYSKGLLVKIFGTSMFNQNEE